MFWYIPIEVLSWCKCNNSDLKEPWSMEQSKILRHSLKLDKHVWCEKPGCHIGQHNRLHVLYTQEATNLAWCSTPAALITKSPPSDQGRSGG